MVLVGIFRIRCSVVPWVDVSLSVPRPFDNDDVKLFPRIYSSPASALVDGLSLGRRSLVSSDGEPAVLRDVSLIRTHLSEDLGLPAPLNRPAVSLGWGRDDEEGFLARSDVR